MRRRRRRHIGTDEGAQSHERRKAGWQRESRHPTPQQRTRLVTGVGEPRAKRFQRSSHLPYGRVHVAGHRLSTGAMEEVLAGHPDVAECAVVGVADVLKGEIPVGFVVLKAGVVKDEQKIVSELVGRVRGTIGPVAAFKSAIVVKRLPKTRSGKTLRGTMKKIADGESYTTPATIEDPAALGEISQALGLVGYPKRT